MVYGKPNAMDLKAFSCSLESFLRVSEWSVINVDQKKVFGWLDVLSSSRVYVRTLRVRLGGSPFISVAT